MDNSDFSDGKVYTQEKAYCEVCKKQISLYDKYDCQLKFKNRFFCHLHMPTHINQPISNDDVHSQQKKNTN